MIQWECYAHFIKEALQIFPVCVMLGHRQCGKTTLDMALNKAL
jgi:hypothetical protein